MRKRFGISVGLGLLLATLAAAQMPTPPPSPTPLPTPGPVIPPGYGCQDPDTAVWVPEGFTRTKITSPPLDPLLPLTGGKQTITEVYRCLGATWRLEQRTTIWSKSTGMAIYPPGAISENGTRKEWFDAATGCRIFKDEMIGRRTKTQADIFSSILQDDRCIWTTDSTDCGNPASTSHRKIERWLQTWLNLGNDEIGNAGYTEDVDNVGYDAAGALVLDFHSKYERHAIGSDPPIPFGTVFATFTLSYYETGKTVAHPMSYSMNFLLKGGGGGGNVWSGAATIPQYDAFGNFVGNASETINQILARGRAHEFFKCGNDDYPWNLLDLSIPIR